MYQQRIRVRLLETGLEDSALVYEGDWPVLPHPGHQIVLATTTGAETLWHVEDIRHLVGIDGAFIHSDVKVRRQD